MQPSTGRVGVNTTNPAYPLDVSGTVNATSFRGDGSQLTNLPAGGSQWTTNGTSIYYSNGNVGVGTTGPVSKLQIGGDVALQSMAGGTARGLPAGGTLIWNDGGWLRLNQNTDYSKPIFGVHTPGVFAPVSLNVGGAGGWGDPGGGNVWITGNVGVGTAAPQQKLDVQGGNIRTSGAFQVGNSAGVTVSMPVGTAPYEGNYITSLVISGGIITGYGTAERNCD